MPKLAPRLAAWTLILICSSAPASELCPEPAKGFGGVPRGTVLEHEFRLTNPGPLPLHIAEVRTSCDCSTANVAQPEIAPQKTTRLTVSIDTAQYKGYRSFTIYVVFDRPERREERLTVSATSLEEVMLSPTNLNLGRIRYGETAKATVRLDYRGVADGWRLTTVDPSNRHLAARFTLLKREQGLVQYEVEGECKGTLPPGHWRLPVYLRTNDPYYPRITVTLEVEVLPLVTASPPLLTWDSSSPRGTVERKVTLRGTKPFRITGFQCADSRCTLTGIVSEAKKVHVLTVRFTAGAQARSMDMSLHLLTDLPQQPRVEVRLRAE